MKMDNKVALITGAASGIGKEIARTFAREGAKIVIADLNQQGPDATAVELGGAGRAIGVAMDVTNEREVDVGVAKALAAFGRIDVLVSNAGIQIALSYAERAMIAKTSPDLTLFFQPHRIGARRCNALARKRGDYAASSPLLQVAGNTNSSSTLGSQASRMRAELKDVERREQISALAHASPGTFRLRELSWRWSWPAIVAEG